MSVLLTMTSARVLLEKHLSSMVCIAVLIFEQSELLHLKLQSQLGNVVDKERE